MPTQGWKYSQNPDDNEILKILKPVTLDDRFNYKCTRCSDCCKKIKASVALETLDAFNLSKHLKMAGDTIWRIEDIISEYATIEMLTDFGYPMFFLNTNSPNDSCVFLKSGLCSIQNGKPRTCRMYPLTAEPADNDEGFNFYLIKERVQHFAGPMIRVGDWMAENLTAEDRAFTRFEIPSVVRIGVSMQEKLAEGVDYNDLLMQIVLWKYIYFDVDKPFMPQYRRNISKLIDVLANMRLGEDNAKRTICNLKIWFC